MAFKMAAKIEKVFVGGLSWETTKEGLLNYFSQYGEVIDCVVMKNPETGKSRGFGFVTYKDPSCLETVLSVTAHIVDGRQVDPKACNPKGHGRGDGGGGGGGGPRMGGHGMDRGPRMNRGPRGGDAMRERKVFIGGLPGNADEDMIRNFFSRYGNVVDVTVMYDAQKQRSRGFGFLTFETDEAVNQVCREHYIHFNGKKVECKRATPRDNKPSHQEEPQFHPGGPGGPHPLGLPPGEMGGHGGPPPQQQGPMPGGPEPNWAPPDGNWNQPPQGPPAQLGAPPQYHIPGGYQGEQGPPPQGVAPVGWPQQPPPNSAGVWPPTGIPPPGQPPQQVTAPFQLGPQPAVSSPLTSTQGFQPPPGAPLYQYTASPIAQSPPGANGQPQVSGLPPQVPSSYGYAPPTYGAQSGAPSHTAQTVQRSYADFTSGQVQLASTVSAVQAPVPAPISTPQTYATYPSPYGAPGPAAAGSPPVTDPYATPTAVPPPQGGVPGVAPQAGQPGALPAGYGSPLTQSPIAAPVDPNAPKQAVDYSSYYSAYGYSTAEANGASAAASAAPYGTQPAPVPGPAQYGAQPESPGSVAYGSGAPGPSPTFQRQSSASQAYHPYARR